MGVPRFGYKGLLNHHVKKSEWVGNETHKLAIDWQIDKKCNSKVNHSQWVQIISEEASVFSKQAFLESLIIDWLIDQINNICFAIFFLEVEFTIEIKMQRKKITLWLFILAKKDTSQHFKIGFLVSVFDLMSSLSTY